MSKALTMKMIIKCIVLLNREQQNFLMVFDEINYLKIFGGENSMPQRIIANQ